MKHIQYPGLVLLLMVCLAGLCLPAEAHAEPLRARPYLPPQPVDWNAPRLVLDLDGKTWREVLEWFADEAGLTFVPRHLIPRGTMRFVSPKNKNGQPRAYALHEIYDLINERLQASEKFTLGRGQGTLTIVSDHFSEVWVVPRIPVWELKNRGRTEFVEISVKLPPGIDPEEFIPCAKRVLGPFAEVPRTLSDTVIIRASVGALLQALPLLQVDAR